MELGSSLTILYSIILLRHHRFQENTYIILSALIGFDQRPPK